jgi:hypothetical protein
VFEAAIVSSLAIAEEDYDTAVGAPIVLKRNLVARSLKEGKTPKILSGAVSIRALEAVQNSQNGGCMDIFTSCCKTAKTKAGSAFEEAKNIGKKGFENAKDILNNNDTTAFNKVEGFTDAMFDQVINQAEEVKQNIEVSNTIVTDFASETENKKNDIVTNLQRKLAPFELLLPLFNNAVVKAFPSVTQIVNPIKKQLSDLKQKGEEVYTAGNKEQEELIGSIDVLIKGLETPIDNFIKEVEKMKSQSNNLFSLVGTLGSALGEVTSKLH